VPGTSVQRMQTPTVAVLPSGPSGATTPSPLARQVAGRERALLLSLGLWAATSIAAGVPLLRAGRAHQRPALTAIGRQAVGWGLVDAGIALWGATRGRRPVAADDAAARRRAARLSAVTSANALLDVGYLAAAARLARDPRRRWDGVGMVPQAALLLWLDTRHSAGFLEYVRPRARRGQR